MADRDHPDKNPDDPLSQRSAFVHRVFCYLERRLPGKELAELQAELTVDAAKRELFVELCITRQNIVQLFNGRAEFKKAVIPSSTASTNLGDAMILPALDDADMNETDADQAMVAPRSISPHHNYYSARWRQTRSARAAAILLPILALPIAWKLIHGTQSPQLASAPTPKNQQLATTDTAVVSDTSHHSSPDHPIVPYPAPVPVVPKQVALATVGVTLDATWDGKGAIYQPGGEIPVGPHSLDTGIVQLKLAGGAVVLVEAPAQFEVSSQNRVSLITGQLSATVPHGTAGLTVHTPDVDAVDLGTAFGLEVVPKKRTHLEVFEGRVQAAVPGKSNSATVDTIVTADHAVLVKAGSVKIESDTPTPLAFMRSQELNDRAAIGGNVGMARWRAFSETLRHDPDLVGYYTFDNQDQAPQKLINRSFLTAGKHDAELGIPGVPDSMPEWSGGRWPEKAAILFGKSPDTVIRIPNDGQLIPRAPFSYFMWIKRWDVKKPVHLLSAAAGDIRCFDLTLIGTDGEKSPVREINSVYFDMGPPKSVQISRDQGVTRIFPTAFNWCLLGLTMGTDSIAHLYIDGQPAGQFPVHVPDLKRNEELWLGRPTEAAKDLGKKLIFQGWIDEFAIFRRVLSDREIQRIYDAGRV